MKACFALGCESAEAYGSLNQRKDSKSVAGGSDERTWQKHIAAQPKGEHDDEVFSE